MILHVCDRPGCLTQIDPAKDHVTPNPTVATRGSSNKRGVGKHVKRDLCAACAEELQLWWFDKVTGKPMSTLPKK